MIPGLFAVQTRSLDVAQVSCNILLPWPFMLGLQNCTTVPSWDFFGLTTTKPRVSFCSHYWSRTPISTYLWFLLLGLRVWSNTFSPGIQLLRKPILSPALKYGMMGCFTSLLSLNRRLASLSLHHFIYCVYSGSEHLPLPFKVSFRYWAWVLFS